MFCRMAGGVLEMLKSLFSLKEATILNSFEQNNPHPDEQPVPGTPQEQGEEEELSEQADQILQIGGVTEIGRASCRKRASIPSTA